MFNFIKNKLALGTVQFGTDYGISNIHGKVSLKKVEEILEFCSDNGINTIDTAQCYGDSESVLGNFDLKNFNIITKINKNNTLNSSLKKLRVGSVYAIMFHKEDDIDLGSWKIFEEYKKEKLVEKIGVSVYSPDRLEEIIDNFPIDIVQFPLNLLDQRFLPVLNKVKEKGIEVHVRSVFLQGLLLMETENINKYFDSIKGIIGSIPKPTILHALNFVKNTKEVDKMVLGVTSLSEIREIYNAYNEEVENIDYTKFRVDKENLINISKWRINYDTR